MFENLIKGLKYETDVAMSWSNLEHRRKMLLVMMNRVQGCRSVFHAILRNGKNTEMEHANDELYVLWKRIQEEMLKTYKEENK